MPKNKGVKGEIGIKDKVTPTLKNIVKEQLNFRQDVKKTHEAMKAVYEKTWKMKIDDNAAYKKISALKRKMSEFKQGLSVRFKIIDTATRTADRIRNKLNLLKKTIVSPMVKLKDATTSKIKAVKRSVLGLGMLIATPFIMLKDKATSKIKSITKLFTEIKHKVPKPVITAVDKTTAVLGKIGSKLKSMAKKLVIPVTVAATVATAAIGASVKSGMQLEQQQISIKHFIGATNKDMDQTAVDKAANEFTQQLRNNANATPFETGEVIQAGSRAISLTQGNRKEAMSLVKLAEDMAAASGGTASVQDAIEALGDAKMGEMERLKSFGFKVSADEFEKKGFKGVSKDLENFFGGASAKLATSGGGLMSTITGKLKSGVADFGLKIVDQLKPVLTNMIGLIDKAMPYIDKLGSAFGSSLGKGIKTVSAAMPTIIATFRALSPIFVALGDGIKAMMPSIISFAGTVVTTIRNVALAATPVIQQIVAAIAQVMPVLEPIFSTIVTQIGNIVTAVLPALSIAIEGIKNVIMTLAPFVQTAFETVGAIITNVIDGITGIIQGGLDLISAIWSGNWQGVVDAFGTIFGGIGEICKAPINAVIGILNWAIDGINSIQVDIPDWVPFAGGSHFGLDLDHIQPLAKGGVVDKATPAIFGEAGREAVVPLEHNTGWMDPVINKITRNVQGASGVTQILQSDASVPYLKSMLQGINLLVSKLSQSEPMPVVSGNPPAGKDRPTSTGSGKTITIKIEKLADKIVVKEEGDIDEIGDKVVKKILEAMENV
ncbi:hypothetical protein MKC66_13115 [[Clostridium] innocuum]|nr:hypothetical protein [[Clostridium] innocuum]